MASIRPLTEAEADLCFGPARAYLPRLPHCIAHASRSVLGTVLSTLTCDGAMWGGGTFPLFDEREERFIPNAPHETFELWSLPKNQDWLRRRGGLAIPDQFAMVVDANTPIDVIQSMYDARAGAGDDAYFYELCFALLVTQWIDDLGWAYVPLNDKTNYALFLASPNKEELALMVEVALTRSGEQLFSWEEPSPETS